MSIVINIALFVRAGTLIEFKMLSLFCVLHLAAVHLDHDEMLDIARCF